MNHSESHVLARFVLSAALMAATTSASARAEERSPTAPDINSNAASKATLVPGQRVRVSAASPSFTGMMTGTLVKLGPDSMILVDTERNVVSELPRNSITRVEVGRERRQTRKGLLIGLGVGALAALSVGASDCSDLDPYSYSGSTSRPCTNGERLVLSAFSLGVYGGIGAWIGHRKKTHDWNDVPMEDSKPAVDDMTFDVNPTLSREGRNPGLQLRVTW